MRDDLQCVFHPMDAARLDEAVKDPRLTLLLREGYTVLTTFMVDVGPDRPQQVALVLAPPSAAQGVVVAAVQALGTRLAVVAGVVVAAMVVVAAAVVLVLR